MKTKYFTRLLSMVMAVTALTACVDDETSQATGDIQPISIVNVGSDTLRIGYLDHLQLTPTIQRGSHVGDVEGLQYRWQISTSPYDMGSAETEWTDLGNGTSLDVSMNSVISTSPYLVKLTVTDSINGNLQATKLYFVYVESNFRDGIVVSSTRDGQSSDFSLVMDKPITLNFAGSPKVFHNILMEGQGKSNAELMTQLTANVYGGSYTAAGAINQVWATTSRGSLYRYDTKSYAPTGTSLSGTDVLTYTGNHPKFSMTFQMESMFFAVSDKGIYSFNPGSANTFGWTNVNASKYTIDNNVIIGNGNYDLGNYHGYWFDARLGRIVNMEYDMGTMASYNDAMPAGVGAFDPAALQGWHAVAGGFTIDGATPAFLFKEPQGDYSVCTLSKPVQPTYDDDWNELTPEIRPMADRRIQLDSSTKALLDKAVSVFFARNEAILYIAVPEGLYAVNFAGHSAQLYSAAKFTPAAGERIVKAKLYTQGHQMIQVTGFPGIDRAVLPWNNKAVVIATEGAQNDGKLYVVPMVQFGTGNLNASSAATYAGFGHILDFCTTGY